MNMLSVLNPLAMQSLLMRFWKAAPNTNQDECWIWGGEIDAHGYGRITAGSKKDGTRKNFLAHRVAYFIANGSLDSSVKVCHRCDTPACVNYKHLFIGTQAENVADMVGKGRHQHGSANGMAKLDDSKVLEILRRTRAGETKAEVSRSIGISRSAISMIASGKRWGHVDI